MQLFSTDAVMFSKKNLKKICPLNMKKKGLDSCSQSAQIFFFSLTELPKQP